MSEQWLIDSIEKGEFLDTNSKRLGIFEGIKVGVLGFGKEDYEELVRLTS
jgi:hypothetical protein